MQRKRQINRLFVWINGEEARSLRNTEMLQHRGVGHRSPSDGKVDRCQLRAAIEGVSLRRQHARLDVVLSLRFDRIVVKAKWDCIGWGLYWLLCSQYARIAMNRSMSDCMCKPNESNRLQK